jgi:periplasmic protein TonB
MAAGPSWEPQPVGRAALLWGGAAVVALLGHGAAAWYALHRPEAVSLPASPPPAVMIELAPEAVAPQADIMELASDLADVEEVIAPEALPEPAPTMVEDQITPPTDLAPLEPPPELLPLPVPPTVIPEVVLPPPQRQVAEPPPSVKTERKAETAKPPAPTKAQTRAKSNAAAPAAKAAASQTGAGAAGAAALEKWQARVMAHLERRKRYPAKARSRREEGVAQVRFTIDDAGNVLSAALVRSSGHPALDAEGLALLRRASPVPAPPPGGKRNITAPILFNIR